MEFGYVYILINESFNGLIKIGSTVLSSHERARQLSANTAVPTPFKVAYEVYVGMYKEFEKLIHTELFEFRVNQNREFFNYPLYKAIQLIEGIKSKNLTINEDRYESIEIMPELLQRFGTNISPNISSVRVYQTNDRVYLEFTRDEYISDYLRDQYIKRTDLAFVIDRNLFY